MKELQDLVKNKIFKISKDKIKEDGPKYINYILKNCLFFKIDDSFKTKILFALGCCSPCIVPFNGFKKIFTDSAAKSTSRKTEVFPH